VLRGYRFCGSGLCSGRTQDLCGPGRLFRFQKLTCAQLANTFQEDADYLTAWYSGWYNGLGKKHMMLVDRAKSLEHQIIVHCKANQNMKVIEAIDVVFKAYRDARGIKLKE
jgi:HdeA/HdeB family